jgi:hypothetical protein
MGESRSTNGLNGGSMFNISLVIHSKTIVPGVAQNSEPKSKVAGLSQILLACVLQRPQRSSALGALLVGYGETVCAPVTTAAIATSRRVFSLKRSDAYWTVTRWYTPLRLLCVLPEFYPSCCWWPAGLLLNNYLILDRNDGMPTDTFSYHLILYI